MDNQQNNLSCCQNNNHGKKGFWGGVCYGLIPHFPCMAFIIFSVLGVTFVASIFRPLMMSSYFFYALIFFSLLLATLSALFYLKINKLLAKKKLCIFRGTKQNKDYHICDKEKMFFKEHFDILAYFSLN